MSDAAGRRHRTVAQLRSHAFGTRSFARSSNKEFPRGKSPQNSEDTSSQNL